MGSGRGKQRRSQSTQHANGVVKALLYRSGSLEKRNDFKPAEEIFHAIDEYAPPGRVKRAEGLFCSATPEEFVRWHNSNKISGYNAEPRRL